MTSEPMTNQRDESVDNIAVQQRAFELYEARGREDGRDQEDWFQARQEILQRPPGASAGAQAGTASVPDESRSAFGSIEPEAQRITSDVPD